jgi:hypothetical protein
VAVLLAQVAPPPCRQISERTPTTKPQTRSPAKLLFHRPTNQQLTTWLTNPESGGLGAAMYSEDSPAWMCTATFQVSRPLFVIAFYLVIQNRQLPQDVNSVSWHIRVNAFAGSHRSSLLQGAFMAASVSAP